MSGPSSPFQIFEVQGDFARIEASDEYAAYRIYCGDLLYRNYPTLFGEATEARQHEQTRQSLQQLQEQCATLQQQCDELQQHVEAQTCQIAHCEQLLARIRTQVLAAIGCNGEIAQAHLGIIVQLLCSPQR